MDYINTLIPDHEQASDFTNVLKSCYQGKPTSGIVILLGESGNAKGRFIQAVKKVLKDKVGQSVVKNFNYDTLEKDTTLYFCTSPIDQLCMVHMKSMLEEPVSRFNDNDEHVQLDANPRILFLDQTDMPAIDNLGHLGPMNEKTNQRIYIVNLDTSSRLLNKTNEIIGALNEVVQETKAS